MFLVSRYLTVTFMWALSPKGAGHRREERLGGQHLATEAWIRVFIFYSAPETQPQPSSFPTTTTMEAIAKYDFKATADDELSFKRGEVLKVQWKLFDHLMLRLVCVTHNYEMLGNVFLLWIYFLWSNHIIMEVSSAVMLFFFFSFIFYIFITFKKEKDQQAWASNPKHCCVMWWYTQ